VERGVAGRFLCALAIRRIRPDGLCMPRLASAKLACAKPDPAKAGGACPGPRLPQEKMGNRRWGMEE